MKFCSTNTITSKTCQQGVFLVYMKRPPAGSRSRPYMVPPLREETRSGFHSVLVVTSSRYLVRAVDIGGAALDTARGALDTAAGEFEARLLIDSRSAVVVRVVDQFDAADGREFLLELLKAQFERPHTVAFALLVLVDHDAVQEHIVRIVLDEVVEHEADRRFIVVDRLGHEFLVQVALRDRPQIVLDKSFLAVFHLQVCYGDQIFFCDFS